MNITQRLKQYERQMVFLRWGGSAEYGKINYVGEDFVEFEVLDVDTMEYIEKVLINSHFLVEVIINEFTDNIDLMDFCVPDNTQDKSYWQVAYMEQYLNLDGTDKLCETYETPAEQSKPSRLVFFLFKTNNQKLSTPYGDFIITNLQQLPDRLAKLIEFDEFD